MLLRSGSPTTRTSKLSPPSLPPHRLCLCLDPSHFSARTTTSSLKRSMVSLSIPPPIHLPRGLQSDLPKMHLGSHPVPPPPPPTPRFKHLPENGQLPSYGPLASPTSPWGLLEVRDRAQLSPARPGPSTTPGTENSARMLVERMDQHASCRPWYRPPTPHPMPAPVDPLPEAQRPAHLRILSVLPNSPQPPPHARLPLPRLV